MKTYRIFTSPLGRMEAVKQGESWPGFFFGGLWALSKKMWGIGFGLLGVTIFSDFIAGFLIGFIDGFLRGAGRLEPTESIFSVRVANRLPLFICMGVMGVCGQFGNRWRENNLLKRGYEYKEIVEAPTPQAALALWVKETREEKSGDF